MFSLLGDPGRALITPIMPVPRLAESMESYAHRVAGTLRVETDDYIGGCSFGALVASAIARRQQVAGLILVAGAVSSETVAQSSRWLARISAWSPGAMVHRMLTSQVFLTHMFGQLTQTQIDLARAMLEQTPREMIVHGARLATSYFPAELPACPIYALHGSLDRIMRPPAVAGCRIVPGAGHGLAVTHAEETTRFLREVLR